jgi:hypothetical protein
LQTEHIAIGPPPLGYWQMQWIADGSRAAGTMGMSEYFVAWR